MARGLTDTVRIKADLTCEKPSWLNSKAALVVWIQPLEANR
jgi:hypothetical protein